MADTTRIDGGFGIYVHWPFCEAKCPYCDFNSHVRHAGVDQPRFAAAFERELSHFAARTRGRRVDSIFLGGGTPSLMDPATVGRVLDAIAGLWSVAPDAEVSMEANPSSVEADRFRGYRAAGVNRLSLGVQALNDGDLRRLGRLHDVAQAKTAIGIARATFERILRPDLCKAGPGWRGLAAGTERGHRSCRRPPVALPAHHRAGHALLRADTGPASWWFPMSTRPPISTT